MKRSLIMRRIILPQAMRIIIPPTGNETIGMLKTTSLVLAVPFTLELQFATNAITSRIYKPIPLLLVACIWYLFITSILMIAQSRLEKHFGKGFEARPIVAEDNGDQQLDGPVAVSETKKDRIARGNNVKMIGLNA